MKDYQKEEGYIFPIIPLCWMIDLPPTLARVASIPNGLVMERRPNGHLFVAVTDADVNVEDPAHIAAGWTLYSVIHPLNTLQRGSNPWAKPRPR